METKRDLQERIFLFAADTCKMSRQLKGDPEILNIRDQLSKSATSVGANYQEAQAGISRADFRNKIRIALKESRESFYWLRLIGHIDPADQTGERKRLLAESKEIMLILGSITTKLDQNQPGKAENHEG